MPRMQTLKTVRFVAHGPCPGCENWMLEYDRDVMMQWPSYDAWCDAIEFVLGEHLEECAGLQEIVFDTL